MTDVRLTVASNIRVMNLYSSRLESFIECPCGKTISGMGLMNQLHTKEKWYRLHQKKCEICRPVRFDHLLCQSSVANLFLKPDRDKINSLNSHYVHLK